MSKTLLVGCDVSSQLNTVCLMDPEGEKIGHQTFSNSLSGAEALEGWLLKILMENDFSELKIAT